MVWELQQVVFWAMNWVRKRASVKPVRKVRGKAMVVGLAGAVILEEVTMVATLAEEVEILGEVEVATLAVVVAISNVQGDGITVPLLIFAN